MARLRPDNQENNINVQEAMLPLWTEITLALDEFLFPKRLEEKSSSSIYVFSN
jgi:hypothetical protein